MICLSLPFWLAPPPPLCWLCFLSGVGAAAGAAEIGDAAFAGCFFLLLLVPFFLLFLELDLLPLPARPTQQLTHSIVTATAAAAQHNNAEMPEKQVCEC
jgi:hypothetical protein